MTDPSQLLDRKVQRWIFRQGWPALREVQSRAIEPILSANRDVLISASTAAGKTEAFFLPACTTLLSAGAPEGCGILYISPLKALINDQYRRLQGLCDETGLTVTPWHGDTPQGLKSAFRRTPTNILLITPESLESMMIREAAWLAGIMSGLAYVVIDEFHAFIGSERGMQLMSLLHRLDHLLGRLERPIPRVALSATLGELESVPPLLRPNGRLPCEIVTSSQTISEVKVQVRGYLDPEKGAEEGTLAANDQIVSDLFSLCRGGSHLVFANSRGRTEELASKLSEQCERQVVPNEFFPHHGSLAKELRESLEARLQQDRLPTTAICTMTLELGIDIGKVNSVVQVTAPHSVSSLRQRMGRSGRRGGPAILRALIAEPEITVRSDIGDKLRLELVQTLAIIRLLIASRWFEPADTTLYHFSTLFHQVLAVTAQRGGIRAEQLYELLCRSGPFTKVTTGQFMQLLRHMGAGEFLTQISSGELVLGVEGERLVNHYSFYAVFKTPEEFRVVSGSKTLGTVPVDSPLMTGQHIIFGGRYWLIDQVDGEKKVIRVSPSKGGMPPRFGGEGMSIQRKVRQEMRQMYLDGDYRIPVGERRVDFIDPMAKSLFEEGITNFRELGLAETSFVARGSGVAIIPWDSDKVVNTLLAILHQADFKVTAFAGIINVENGSVEVLMEVFRKVSQQGIPSEERLAASVPNKEGNKFDQYLPPEILDVEYGMRMFNCWSTANWLENHT